jgi:alkylated DNA repair dioxygenase AlkB
MPIDRKAPTERVTLDEGSWVDVVRRFAPDTDDLFEVLRTEMTWTQGSSIREGKRIPDPRLGASLRVEDLARIPVLHFTRLALEARYRIRLGGVGLVLYRNGRDSVGFHGDDEMRWLDNTIVAGLCFGAERPVAIKPRGRPGEAREILLGSGDLYVMGGRCQADWLHAVPKVEECGPRISAIWRWTSRQGPPWSSPTHFVPDAPRKRYWR